MMLADRRHCTGVMMSQEDPVGKAGEMNEATYDTYGQPMMNPAHQGRWGGVGPGEEGASGEREKRPRWRGGGGGRGPL